MARNYKFFFDKDGSPKARGPAAEKILMTFLETDVQGSDHICRDLMDDLTAIEDGSDDSREFIGNAHQVVINTESVILSPVTSALDAAEVTPEAGAVSAHSDSYHIGLKHFREVLEDWEAFIMDDQVDDSIVNDEYL